MLLLLPNKGLCRLLQCAGGSLGIGRADFWSAPRQYRFLILLRPGKLIFTCVFRVVFAFQGTLKAQNDLAQVVALF